MAKWMVVMLSAPTLPALMPPRNTSGALVQSRRVDISVATGPRPRPLQRLGTGETMFDASQIDTGALDVLGIEWEPRRFRDVC
jgi:hypothetical protein